jgi:hypothetical protein
MSNELTSGVANEKLPREDDVAGDLDLLLPPIYSNGYICLKT